jgi:hypothetical protein
VAAGKRNPPDAAGLTVVQRLCAANWAVDYNRGLGAALQFHYGSMPDSTPSPAPTVHSKALTLLFSSTFN